MATQVIPAPEGSKIVSFNYSDATATAQIDVFDNDTLGWLIDDTGAAAAKPAIIGALPPVVSPTPPLTAPNWAHVEGDKILLPDIARPDLGTALTHLAKDNGANRKIACHFTTQWLHAAWIRWATYNPTLVVPGSVGALQAPAEGATGATGATGGNRRQPGATGDTGATGAAGRAGSDRHPDSPDRGHGHAGSRIMSTKNS